MSISATARKETYFIPTTPSTLDGAQFVAVNRTGTVLFGLRIRIEVSIVELAEPGEPPEIMTTVAERSVCKYHVASGHFKTFRLDNDWDASQLARVVDFYTLHDDVCVVVNWDADKFALQQTVVHLEPHNGWAQTVVVKRMTLSRVSGTPMINLSFIDRGRIMVCGARHSMTGTPERLLLSIPANPLNGQHPHEDLSSLIDQFNAFLVGYENAELAEHQLQLASLFVLNIDELQISMLLAEIPRAVPPPQQQDEPMFSTKYVGIIDRATPSSHFSVMRVDNASIECDDEPLKVSAIGNLRARNGSVWMSFTVPNLGALRTWYWRFKHFYIRIMLRLMVAAFHGSLFLWRFDNGRSFVLLTRVLQWLHGPSMIPVFTPQKRHILAFLDTRRRRFHRVPHAARIFENPKDPNVTDFGLSFDVDASGGALVLDFPREHTKEQEQMALTYYPNPTKTQSLARISMYSAYRNFPSFEKSSLLRRFTGVLDWKWAI